MPTTVTHVPGLICHLCTRSVPSNNLTVNYKRVLYLLKPTEEAIALRGKRVMVHESEDGEVRICHGMLEFPARPFPRDDARIGQGAVVEHKLLSAVFEHIRQKQRERDQRRLASGKLTLRERALLERTLQQVAE